MKTLLKTLFLVIVVSIFLFSDNKTISTARNFCAVNGKVTYDVVANKVKGWVSDGTKKAVAYVDAQKNKK